MMMMMMMMMRRLADVDYHARDRELRGGVSTSPEVHRCKMCDSTVYLVAAV